MLFSHNMHAQIISTSWLISFTSAKMDMHSNSRDIQQKDVDGVPHVTWFHSTSTFKKTKTHKIQPILGIAFAM